MKHKRGIILQISASEDQRKELLTEIERLKAKIEYEMQPNIAFEKEIETFQKQVSLTRTLIALWPCN